MTKTIRVGIMPGRIQEVAVETGTSIKEVIELAGLDSQGYDIKVDGDTVTEDSVVSDETNLVLLVKQVKGNSGPLIVRVGVMPGRIQEHATEAGATVGSLVEQAGLDAEGYDIKMDGETVTAEDRIESDTNLVLLVKQVKGNK